MRPACLLILLYLVSDYEARAEKEGIIGIDLTSFIRERAPEMIIGFSFTERWSCDIHADLGTLILRNRLNHYEKEHYTETEDHSEMNMKENIRSRFRIHLRHWTGPTYNSPFVSGGIVLYDNALPDVSAETGYAFRICKGIGAYITYEMTLLKAYRDGVTSGQEIKIGLQYTF